MKYFEYGQKEMDWLIQQDKTLGEYILQRGYIQREMQGDLFECLVFSVLGQQISNKALDTVKSRLLQKTKITPEGIVCLGVEELKSCGTSLKKAQNVLDVAKKINDGTVCLTTLKNQPDEQIVKTLVSFDGVGVWTAEMALIFALGRKNVLSFGDFGIKKGLCLLYGHDKIDKKTFDFYRQKFDPYCTIAGFYLWDKANKN